MAIQPHEKIIVQVDINSNINKVWKYFTQPEHIIKWNFAIDDWHCPTATNELKPNGKFNYRMEARNGQFGFDFTGTYIEIIENKLIKYRLDDKRKVKIKFSSNNDVVSIIKTFEIEDLNTSEQQKMGWQSILNNFKKYVENH